MSADGCVSDLEDTIRRIQDHKGVMGMIIINGDGVAVRSSMDTSQTNSYSAVLSRLSDQARSAIRDLDPVNDVSFMRIRTKKNEILLAPDKDFTLIVIQSPVEGGETIIPGSTTTTSATAAKV